MKIKITTPNKVRTRTVIRNNKHSYTIQLDGDYKGTMKIFKKWLDGIDVPNGYKVEELIEKPEKKERYITCTAYERAMKRTENAVLRNMGH